MRIVSVFVINKWMYPKFQFSQYESSWNVISWYIQQYFRHFYCVTFMCLTKGRWHGTRRFLFSLGFPSFSQSRRFVVCVPTDTYLLNPFRMSVLFFVSFLEACFTFFGIRFTYGFCVFLQYFFFRCCKYEYTDNMCHNSMNEIGSLPFLLYCIAKPSIRIYGKTIINKCIAYSLYGTEIIITPQFELIKMRTIWSGYLNMCDDVNWAPTNVTRRNCVMKRCTSFNYRSDRQVASWIVFLAY